MKERSTSTQQYCSVVGDHTWRRTGAVLVSMWNHALQLGGRPKRKAGSGRPSIKDINTVISHLECIAPYPLVPYTSIMPTALDKQLSVNAECPLCLMLLNSPVELINCGAVVCFQCCCLWLETSGTLSCPCCYKHCTGCSKKNKGDLYKLCKTIGAWSLWTPFE